MADEQALKDKDNSYANLGVNAAKTETRLQVFNEDGTTPVTIESTDATADTPEYFEDTSFVVGDSPVTLDCNTALGQNATGGYIINDGAGNFTVAFSTDGAAFGDAITMKKNEVMNFENLSVDSLKITHIADSAYRVSVV